MREPRVVLYTNDAVILSLAGFPYYVSRLNIRSTSTTPVARTTEGELYVLRERYLSELVCKPPKTYLPPEDFVSLLPRGFTPKIERMDCVTGGLDHLRWVRTTIHPGYTLSPHSEEIVKRVDRVWAAAARIPLVEELYGKLRQKRLSVLILETINGSPREARNIRRLWPVFYDVVQGGNDLARTPVCDVVERCRVERSVWDYRPLDRETDALGRLPPEEVEVEEVESR